jgi:hypothetical protein
MKKLRSARKPLPSWARAAAFAGALALGLAIASLPALADSCEKIVGAIDSMKAMRTDAESQQEALQKRIGRIDKSSQSYRQKLQSGKCRPEGAATDTQDDKRPSCKALLQFILSAGKLRDSLKQRINRLNKMTADSNGDQDKLVQMAKADGCPPYGSKPKSAEAEEPAPKAEKKAAHHRSRRRHVRAERRHPRRRSYERSGGGAVVHFGGGGVGIGFSF